MALSVLIQGYQKQVMQKKCIVLLRGNAVMHTMYHLVDNDLQFQLYPLLFVHLTIVLG